MVMGFADLAQIQQRLPNMASQLALCQKALADYLEDKRSALPRCPGLRLHPALPADPARAFCSIPYHCMLPGLLRHNLRTAGGQSFDCTTAHIMIARLLSTTMPAPSPVPSHHVVQLLLHRGRRPAGDPGPGQEPRGHSEPPEEAVRGHPQGVRAAAQQGAAACCSWAAAPVTPGLWQQHRTALRRHAGVLALARWSSSSPGWLAWAQNFG